MATADASDPISPDAEPDHHEPTFTDPVRVDRWLWCVRLFPSRSASTQACSSGKVSIDGEPVKPARKVTLGETITVRRKGFDMVVVVRDLIPRRVGAPIAVTCYDDLSPPRPASQPGLDDDLLGADPSVSGRRDHGSGRPTKRDRRQIDRLRRERR